MPRTSTLAIAVSRHATAGDMIAPGTWTNQPRIENVGLWVSAPPPALTDLNGLPEVLRPLLEPLRESTSAVFTLGQAPASSNKDGFELKLVATAKDGAGATKIAKQYSDFTSLVTRVLEAGKTPISESELSGMLTGGRFNTKDNEVTATWPISKQLVESLASAVDVGNKK